MCRREKRTQALRLASCLSGFGGKPDRCEGLGFRGRGGRGRRWLGGLACDRIAAFLGGFVMRGLVRMFVMGGSLGGIDLFGDHRRGGACGGEA